MLSFSIAFVSIFFIIIQGISLGDDKVKKWLSSMFISVFTSVFIMQPIQVFLIIIFTHSEILKIILI